MAKRRKRRINLGGSKEMHVEGAKRALAEVERSTDDAIVHAKRGNCNAAVTAFVRANYATGRMDAHAASGGIHALETIRQRKMLIDARNAIAKACSLDLR